ncbi:MAG: hypothetical protein ACHREM_10110 [Polyangiales bacterium]
MDDAEQGPSGDRTSPALDAGAALGPIACPPAPLADPTTPTYVPAVAHQGLCTQAEIAGYVSACIGPSPSAADCGQWWSTNITASTDAGIGTPCGRCFVSPSNNGALWEDSLGLYAPNYGRCIQLLDPVDGIACAPAYENRRLCRDVACQYCPSFGNSDFADCLAAADQSTCSAFATTFQAACAHDLVDGGAFGECHPSPLAGGPLDYTYIADLICGGASADAGAD